MVATNYMWRFKYKFMNMKSNLKFGVLVPPATFQGLTSHVWLLTTMTDVQT